MVYILKYSAYCAVLLFVNVYIYGFSECHCIKCNLLMAYMVNVVVSGIIHVCFYTYTIFYGLYLYMCFLFIFLVHKY